VSQHEEKEWLVERQKVLCWAVCTAGVVCVGELHQGSGMRCVLGFYTPGVAPRKHVCVCGCAMPCGESVAHTVLCCSERVDGILSVGRAVRVNCVVELRFFSAACCASFAWGHGVGRDHTGLRFGLP
jgi:predicted nucleic acid-binding Zn ribbon protein